MISFREFLLEKNALTKHLEKGGEREKVFQGAKKFAQSAWLRNANKKAKKEGGTTKTISDAPEGIKNAQNYSDLLKSISSWKDDDNTIHNNAYSTIVSMGKSLDKTSKEKENAEDKKNIETSQDAETSQDTENDQDVENTSDNQDGEEKQDSENEQGAETSQDTGAEQLQKEVQKHLDNDYEKEREEKFKELLPTSDKQNIKVANAKEKQAKKDAADVIFQKQKDYQLARKKVLEALSELIKLLFNDVDTSKITGDADKEIEKITQKQAMHHKIKQLPKDWDNQIKAREDFCKTLIEEGQEIINAQIEKINVDYPPSVKDMKIEHKQKRDEYVKTLKKEIEEKNKDNEKYQQFKELGNKKATDLTPEEQKQFDSLKTEFGIDSQMSKWDEQNKLDNEEIEKMTKEWRERQIAQAKESLEEKRKKWEDERDEDIKKLKRQKDEMLEEIENYKKTLDRGGDEQKVAQRILKMSMDFANVNDKEEETEDKEEIKEHFEKLQYECRKQLYEKKIDKEYKKLLRHFL